MHEELLYQIALTKVYGIGPVQARILMDNLGSAEAIFKASKKVLSSIEGIGEIKANSIKKFDNYTDIETEIAFCEKHHIQIIGLNNPAYPQKLLLCYDAPTILYYRGNANLNNPKIISIIGTRNNTDYGKQITEEIVAALQPLDVLIVSGLAFGIDALAHKAAIQNQLSTVGVLAHGLGTIYPSQHKTMAKDMLLNGGLLTEFGKNTLPDKHNFPRRNRIVAGIADATIVIETAIRGGSMITAEMAYSYNRDLFAVPGRIHDPKTAGCLKLIAQNKASIISSADFLLETLGWKLPSKKRSRQKELFVELTEDEKNIVALLESKEGIHIDEIYMKSGLSSSSVAGAILNLELNNIVISLPGKMYRLS